MTDLVMEMLVAHRDALKTAKTFEEYRDAHVRWVEWLISRRKAEVERRAILKAGVWEEEKIDRETD